jgi:cysteinyl-tRNA synthetase
MALRLYDTLSQSLRPFETGEPGRAGIYVCGPTVYDYPHLGHVRCYVAYDVLVRHLRATGTEVNYVRNITDIEDKIIARAKERGVSPRELAQQFTDVFGEDMARVGVLPADIEPKVSEHLDDIIALIQTLIDKDVAYVAEGSVYFHVPAFPEYGKLSHRRLDDLQHGGSGRIDEAEAACKKCPADFALWKADDDPEATWPSPWGPGRPGWHIECSAMSLRHLGSPFDLHGGGLDLVFPHHENEIAQSEAATGQPVTRMWVHNGFVEVNKEKMSKSLGNFFTAREVFRFVEPEAVRWFVLSVHYRAPLSLDWTLDDEGKVVGFPQIEEAERRLEYLYRTRQRIEEVNPKRVRQGGKVAPEIADVGERLRAALDEDLNFAVANAVVADFLKHVNEAAERGRGKAGVGTAEIDAARAGFAAIERVLGLGGDDPEPFVQRVQDRRIARMGIDPAKVDGMIAARAQARADKDFARADALRDELSALGVEVMDGAEGSRWRVP